MVQARAHSTLLTAPIGVGAAVLSRGFQQLSSYTPRIQRKPDHHGQHTRSSDPVTT